MFVDFGCCMLRMVLTANKFMYSKPLCIEEFLSAYRSFYVVGFITDVLWKLNFNALSPVCNFFGEAKKLRVNITIGHYNIKCTV